MKNVTPVEAQKIIQDGNNVEVIDVRTPEEFREGHIKSARNINIYDEVFPEKIQKLPLDKTYVVVCRGGARSAQACSIMNEAGFPHIVNIEGGMVAWGGAGLPMEK